MKEFNLIFFILDIGFLDQARTLSASGLDGKCVCLENILFANTYIAFFKHLQAEPTLIFTIDQRFYK